MIHQLEDARQRDKPLQLKDADHVFNQLSMGIRRIGLARTGQQIDHAILRRNSGWRFGCRQQRPHPFAAPLEDIPLVLHFREMAEDCR